jgi:hypothetical protein
MSENKNKLNISKLNLILGCLIILTTLFSGVVSYLLYSDSQKQAEAADRIEEIAKTDFIKYDDPILVSDKEVSLCGDIGLTFSRTSSLAVELNSETKLNKLQQDGSILERVDGRVTGKVEPSENKKLSVTKKIPCEVEPGTYYFSGIFNYTYEGVTKEVTWQSEKFEVIP